MGLGATDDEIQIFVRDYVTVNMPDQTVFKNGVPGHSWVSAFKKRNILSTGKAGLIQSLRIQNASNPFLIYDFYDTLEEIYAEYPDLTAEGIWNLDETGMPTEVSKVRVTAPVGEKKQRIRHTAGREQHTVLACVSATGVVLDPLISYKGKN